MSQFEMVSDLVQTVKELAAHPARLHEETDAVSDLLVMPGVHSRRNHLTVNIKTTP